MSILTVYIGYDSREPVAYEVCKHSILKHASKPVNIQPLKLDKLQKQGLLPRPLEKKDGRWFDPVSNAYASTEFSISRFLPFLMQQEGWAVFMDCDMLFLGDIYDLLKEADSRYAVQCVQHDYIPQEDTKMDGQVQDAYFRKNWSSFFLFNASHEANQRLELVDINVRPGRELHRFYWLHDREIGPLQAGWNWLVDVQPKPEPLYNAHFTLGGPWFPGWEPKQHDELWLEAMSSYSESVLDRSL